MLAINAYQAQQLLVLTWTQTHGDFVNEYHRRHINPAAGDAQLQDDDVLRFQLTINTPRPADAILARIPETVTRLEAGEIEKHDSKLKKFEDDARTVINIVKLHLTTHAQEPLKLLWNSTAAGQTLRRKAIATFAYIRSFSTTFNSTVVTEICGSIQSIQVIHNFKEAMNAADQVSIFQEELLLMSTAAHPVHKTDCELIESILVKFSPHVQEFNSFKIHHCLAGALAAPTIPVLLYGQVVVPVVPAEQLTFNHLKDSLKQFDSKMNPITNPQDFVFSATHAHVEPSSSFAFGNSSNPGFSPSSSSSSSNHHTTQKVQELQKELQRISRLLEQQSGRSSSPAGSRAGSPSRGTAAFSSNSFV